jgi:hypothetical protein
MNKYLSLTYILHDRLEAPKNILAYKFQSFIVKCRY